MSDSFFALLLTLFVGLATGVGGAAALVIKKNNLGFLSLALSFSAGVLIYLSFVEIFNRAHESLAMVHGDEKGFLFTTIAFFSGIALIALIDKFTPHTGNKTHDDNADTNHNNKKELKRTGLMSALAVAIHNFPEGLVTFMGAVYDPALGVGIAIAVGIHNIPLGIAISVPIYYSTGSKLKAILLATASGLTWPLGALFAYFLFYNGIDEGVFGFIFAAVGGIMVFVSLHELLPSAHKYGKHHQIMKGLFAGMIVMAFSLIFFGG